MHATSGGRRGPWFPGGEMAVEQWHMDYIFIDLWGRDFRGLNREFVSRRRASLHAGMDITLNSYDRYI